MKYNNLGSCRTIDEYVQKKLAALSRTERGFADLFSFMFSEMDAVLYERSVGYKMVKTTYGEAYDRALCLAVALKDRLSGAAYDATVGIYMENSVEWIETFWAVLAAGYRPLLLNLRLDPALLREALSDTGAVAVISDKDDLGDIFSLPLLRPDLPADHPLPLDKARFGTAIYVMSTGTSGHIKICAYGSEEFATLVSDSSYIVRVCAQIKRHHKGDLKLLTFLPLYHVFGLIAMYIWFAFFSRTFVHLGDMEPSTILNTIRRHEVTHIFAVPLFWERICDAADRTIRDKGEATLKKYQKGIALARKLEAIPPLGRAFKRAAFREVRENLFGESVQFMITGGSPIRADALAFFNDIGYHLTNGYGMTEIGITSVELSGDARRRKSASVGAPLPSVTYAISESGELLVKGKSLAAATILGGVTTPRGDDWFHTGDLAVCERGGYRILGRADDLILLSNGEMLNPNLIEPAFRLPAVTEVCLVDAARGHAAEPILLLVAEKAALASPDKRAALEAEVDRVLREKRLDTVVRRVVYLTDSLLRPNDFKLNRTSICERYLAGDLTAPASASKVGDTADTPLERQVASLFAAALEREIDLVGVDADFFSDLGGSSLDYFALLSALKETFSLPFAETETLHFRTVRCVCRYIEEQDSHAS